MQGSRRQQPRSNIAVRTIHAEDKNRMAEPKRYPKKFKTKLTAKQGSTQMSNHREKSEKIKQQRLAKHGPVTFTAENKYTLLGDQSPSLCKVVPGLVVIGVPSRKEKNIFELDELY